MSKDKNLQSGLMLCKSFSPKPFWVLFGNVKEAKFMLDEDDYIYRDKRGYGFLLIPTMTIGNVNKFGGFKSDEFMERCWSMGLREHPNYFFALIYSLPLATFNDIIKNKVAEGFKDLYSKEELLIRYADTYNRISSAYSYFWYYEKTSNTYITNAKDDFNLQSKIQILNVLLVALDIKNEKEMDENLSQGMKLKETFLK